MTRLSAAEARKLGVVSDAPKKRSRKAKDNGPPLLEKDIQAAIKQYLQLRGWYVVKIHQSLGSHKGIADLYAIKGGLSVWIEVKTPAGILSDHQRTFRDEIESHGGVYYVARSVDDVVNTLGQF